MSTRVRRSGIAALLFIALASCSESATAPNSVLPDNSMTAKINNVEFRVLKSVFVTHQHGVLSIAAFDNTQRSIHLTMLAPVRPTTITVGPGEGGNSGMTMYGSQLWRTDVAGGTGTVTITSVTANQATGTFSFTGVPAPGTANKNGASGTMTVNGAFNVTYVQQ